MRRKYFSSLILGAFILLTLSFVRAEDSLPQQYMALFVKLHDSENLEKEGDLAGSLKSFREVYDGYDLLRKNHPDWETALVGHRMDDCKVTIQRLENELATSQKDSKPVEPLVRTVFVKEPRKEHPPYPWKAGIATNMFWLGEGSPAANAWNIRWPKGAQNEDTPGNRNGFSSGEHASYFNPFYVALPFNDLTHPDKAKEWVPPQWQRAPQDGQPVSACQHRWVEIKTEDGTGHTCYAQWEDVGPVNNDDAPYVFGNERSAAADHLGLLISPAVVQYLGLADNKNNHGNRSFLRWRFVDETDVQPGIWLKLDEEAIIYTAMHQAPDLAATPLSSRSKKETPTPAELAPHSTKP